ESLDDSNKGPRQPRMANNGLVIASVDSLGASPEELYGRRAVLAERSSFLRDAKFARIEREMRDDELARFCLGLQLAVGRFERGEKAVKCLFEQLGRNGPDVVVPRFNQLNRDAYFVWPDWAAHTGLRLGTLSRRIMRSEARPGSRFKRAVAPPSFLLALFRLW